MGYIGATPSNNFITTDSQRVTSSTNNYVDLDNAISSLDDVIVYVNSVKQDITNLTFTSASRIGLGGTLVSSDVVEIVYLGKAVATQTPGTGTVTLDMLSASGTKSSSTFLRGDNTFATAGADADNYFATSGLSNKDLGVGLHIKTGDSGASVSGNTDELVIENSGNAGIGILSGATSEGAIYFSDSGDSERGRIIYKQGDDYMRFITAGDERMRILNDGAVKIVRSFFVETERDDTFKMNAEFGGNAEGGILLNDKDGANNGTFMSFKRSNTQIGTIRRNGTNDSINFNTSSDYRLKDGIVDLTGGIDTIKKLKPRKFYWKSDTDKNLVDGFIAHEVQDVAELSHAVTGVKDGTRQITDGDGVTATEIDTQGLDYSKLVTYLTAALQESITKIETLETEMTALKARVQTLEDA